MSKTLITKHYTRLLALWPKDALRPNLPFTRTIEHRALPYGRLNSEPRPEDAQSKPTSTPPLTPPNPQFHHAQINALYSLLEDRYTTKHQLSPAVLKPASSPDHYDRLMAEIERAPKKTWWQAKIDEWKMKVRFS
ncbi:hypothetical protein GQ44DRAFT_682987 [Phaeosphaeriaceae sp. PMI808]|nr:hypothetical protein GQ44DRAFT_682987 [Phaeosphaeriaceae sp. PMI808]